MAQTYQMHTLANLRQIALMYSHEVDSASSHWGNLANVMVNEGVRQMWMDAGGVQDLYTFNTVEGQQTYPLPLGTLSIERVLFDNTSLSPLRVHELDTNTPEESFPAGYTLYNKPYPTLWLVPGPADAAYSCTVFLRRSPREMTVDTDTPELPPQWQLAPAYWAGMQFAIADGSPAAQVLGQLFAKMKGEMGAWMRNNSKDRYPTVAGYGESRGYW